MKPYMIICTVNGIDYLTKVNANSEYGAEHTILDLAYCGKHTYGVTACMAYGIDAMKYDIFRCNAMDANPVSLESLKEIISVRNAEIRKKDEAEDRIRQIEKQIKELEEELKAVKAALE